MSVIPVYGQSGPGGVGDPTTNRFWYDANQIVQSNNTVVSSWINVGGNGTSADQPTAANQPIFLTNQINGFPSVKFDGTNDYLTIASNTDLDNGGPYSDRSFFMVIRTGTNVTSRQVIYEEGGGTRGLDIYIFNGNIYYAGWNLANDGPGSPWGFLSANTAIAANTTYVIGYIFSGNSSNTGTIACYLNGTLFSTINNAGLLYNHNPAILGAENSGAYYETGSSSTDGKYFSGDIPEFIMYNTSVNLAQRYIIENYLAAKYGVALSANDYYTMDDPGNGNYDYEVAGIGQVNNPANVNTDAQGTSDVRISGPVGMDDNEYLMWGHDNGSTAFNANETDVPAGEGVNSRYDRIWRASMVGSIDSYDLRFYLGSCVTTSVNNVYLLIDTNGDGNFADETTAGGGVVLLSNIAVSEYIVTGLSGITDGSRFTFGFDGGAPPVYLSALGPGGIGDNTVNRFWFDANDIGQSDNTTISNWANKGGNANGLTQSTGSYRPTFLTNQQNGFPLVKFDGSDDYLALANNTDLNTGGPYTERTFLVMFRTGTNVSNRQVIYEEGGTGRGLNIYIYGGNVYLGAYNLNADSPDTPWGFSYLNTPVTINTNYILTYEFFGNTCATGTVKLYLNGSLIGTINGLGQLFAHSAAIGFGARNGDSYYETGVSSGNGDYFNGYLGEFIMYNYVLNTAQRIIIENYLAAKYGLTLTANDVYSMDDSGNGNYDYQVAGIGRDDAFNFDDDSKGPGIVHIDNPSDLGDNEYFIWGNDNQALNATGVTDLPPGIELRLARTWRPSGPGDVGTIDISFDMSSVAGGASASDLRLLVDRNNNGIFADETSGGGGIISGATDEGSSVYKFSGVSINNNERFTIGSIDAITTPLPVSLLFFTGKSEKHTIQLHWATASESDNDFFTIEKSGDGENFAELLSVKGAGNSMKRKDYYLTDYSPLQGFNYFRLSQTDFNGQKESFKIISVYGEPGESAVTIFPNPCNGNITLRVPDSGNEMKVFNTSGHEVYHQTLDAASNHVDLSGQPSGLYIVRVNTPLGPVSRKLIIRK